MGIEDRIKYLDGKFCLSDEFFDIIRRDAKERFILEIRWIVNKFSSQSQKLVNDVLWGVLTHSKIKCAEALITGQTPLTVDLNLPCIDDGIYPLHLAAFQPCSPSIVELLLCYGAQTNIRLSPGTYIVKGHAGMLPLQIALQGTEFYYLYAWAPKHSIYKLVTIFCLPRLQNQLEAIGLLAGMTKETEEVFLEYAVQGKIIEFAALLMVAHKKLNNVMQKVRQYFDSIENNNPPIGEDQKEKVASMQQLVEVFERAGDDISAYLKEDKFYVSKYQTIVDITRLLVDAGFQLQQSDADLSCYVWFGDRRSDPCYREAPYEGRRCLNDFGMAHYSKSGYRWKVSNKDPWWRFLNIKAYINELENEVEGLKAENVDIKKQQQQPNLRIWMDDELGKALEEDDREEFLSVIDRKPDFFRSRQQQLLYVVCGFGSIKCAEALLKGETYLTVELNHPCTDTGMYPLHCAALSLFPSIVELFLCSGARTDIRFRPCNPSDIFPHYRLEAHANKLPLHMALWGISRLPCIREWSPKHTIARLVTLLCLPRMQNPLETLCLLAGTTDEIENEYIDLARDGKVVELAAMHIATVGNEKLHDIVGDAYGSCMSFKKRSMLDKDQTQKLESVLSLLELFEEVDYNIAAYVKEDKYNVTKYQAIEDVTCMLQQTDFPLEPSDTDLSVYSWYRDEEPSYPSKAPYENVRLLHDVGMEHYFRSGFRWMVSEKEMLYWRYSKTKAYIKEMENQIECLKEENAKEKKQLKKVLKPAAFGVPYIHCQGVPIASSGFFSPNAMRPKVEQKMRRIRGTTSSCNLQNFPSRRTMTSTMALLFKRIMKHMTISR